MCPLHSSSSHSMVSLRSSSGLSLLSLLLALLLVDSASSTKIILISGNSDDQSDFQNGKHDDEGLVPMKFLRPRRELASSKVLAALKKHARKKFDFTKVKQEKRGKVNSQDDPTAYYCAHAYSCKALQDNAESSDHSDSEKKLFARSAEEVCSAAMTMLDDSSDSNEDKCEDLFEDSTNSVPTSCGQAVQTCSESGGGLVTCLASESSLINHDVNACAADVDCSTHCVEDDGSPITRLCICTLSIESATKKVLKEAEEEEKKVADDIEKLKKEIEDLESKDSDDSDDSDDKNKNKDKDKDSEDKSR